MACHEQNRSQEDMFLHADLQQLLVANMDRIRLNNKKQELQLNRNHASHWAVHSIFLAVSLATFLTVGCGNLSQMQPTAAPGLSPTLSTTKAFVSHDQYQRAISVINSIDYLPFTYLEDGCYARSFYMSMELATQRIQSSAQFIKSYAGPLEVGDINWSYHVAPVLVPVNDPLSAASDYSYQFQLVNESSAQRLPSNALILDPGLGHAPIPLREWVSTMLTPYTEAYTALAPGNYYAPYHPIRENETEPMIRGFSDLKRFRTQDIQKACGVMKRYISFENLPSTLKIQKQQKLMSRTQQLINSLAYLGKLNTNSMFDPNCPFVGH